MTTLTALAALADTNRRNAETFAAVAQQLGITPRLLADRESVTVYWSTRPVGTINVAVESSYRLEDGILEHGICVDGSADGDLMDVEGAGEYVTAFTDAQNLLRQVTDAIAASGRVNLLKSA
ncbi:hypothetical protein O4158_00025 [Gordonia amicalis]|uniref:hypothetical protein n=1 Tax=Gordonia amicalis TaxID=89053 RepID=UPI0022B3AC7F|nr:hypothetical protein [Gordonia amicalis]MCZ4577505.1 hypothetical protein [Gordonia amicalis]